MVSVTTIFLGNFDVAVKSISDGIGALNLLERCMHAISILMTTITDERASLALTLCFVPYLTRYCMIVLKMKLSASYTVRGYISCYTWFEDVERLKIKTQVAWELVTNKMYSGDEWFYNSYQ